MVQLLLIDLLTPPLVVTPLDVKKRQSLVTSVRTQLAKSIAFVYSRCRGSIREKKPRKSKSPINGNISVNGDDSGASTHSLRSL